MDLIYLIKWCRMERCASQLRMASKWDSRVSKPKWSLMGSVISWNLNVNQGLSHQNQRESSKASMSATSHCFRRYTIPVKWHQGTTFRSLSLDYDEYFEHHNTLLKDKKSSRVFVEQLRVNACVSTWTHYCLRRYNRIVLTICPSRQREVDPLSMRSFAKSDNAALERGTSCEWRMVLRQMKIA